MTFRYATPDVVALAWAAQAPGIVPSMVGDQLPVDNSTWAASGFITPTVSGGGANAYYRLDQPVVTLQCWACRPGTDLAPWGKAGNLAETLRAATYLNRPVFVSLSTCDENARVLSSSVVGSPRKVYGDIGDYAAFTVDVQLHWVPIPQ
ncbi:hypothetical protein ATK30_6855 [Amycolatopsis echigonensis]|uniref:DUF3168 domain-containing protein n=1 Tax=Amycolatopsis echigonensis TaxID=2576905 RepID=A0A2N3WPZ7_9PSEU|nr:hypothetical protein [Amycolatopsis niigatensis]PKV95922.1 hypothetical protein ATK30_6855 [Amycolatopsis niigatensis]